MNDIEFCKWEDCPGYPSDPMFWNGALHEECALWEKN